MVPHRDPSTVARNDSAIGRFSFAKLGASGIGDPSGLSAAIGEVLVATASGLFIAIPAFGAFYFLRNRAAASIHRIQDIVNSLFRKMPYESLAGIQLGDEELFAAIPNWMVHLHGSGKTGKLITEQQPTKA